MQVRALALPTVVGLVVALVAGPAHAAPAPTVSRVWVAGNGPLDLYDVIGYGFTPGHSVALALEDGATARDLGSFTVTSAGSVGPTTGSRIPADVTPGLKTIRLTQDDGLTVESHGFTINAPALIPPPALQSNSADMRFDLTGLANTPDVQRTLSVDGQPLGDVRWYSDDRSFDDPGIHATLPPLHVGAHTVSFTQTVQTPFTTTAEVDVVPATLTAPAEAATRQRLAFTASGAGRDDVLAVTVVGAARDRHPLGTIRVLGDSTTDAVTLDGVSPGQATATFVSVQTGGVSTATFTVLPTTLTAPNALASNGSLWNQDGTQRLTMQTDGNLVDRVNGMAVWSTHTEGHPGATVRVQDDGNLVVRDPAGHALWSTGTAGTGAGGHLVTSPPQLTLTTASGRRIWSEHPFSPPDGEAGSLSAGEYMAVGDQRANEVSGPRGPIGWTFLIMASDGNLYLTGDWSSGPGVRWQTHTSGHLNAYAILQTDGNFVVRAADGRTLWANYARAGNGARIVLQTDGNMVERAADGHAVWSTGTVVRPY